MHITTEILGKKILVELTVAAEKTLNTLVSPLRVEMELYFSCLIRKTVRFNPTSSLRHGVVVTPKLSLGFRPVVTQSCKVSAVGRDEAPPVEDFHMNKPEAFVPKKIVIDFKRGQWVGQFYMS